MDLYQIKHIMGLQCSTSGAIAAGLGLIGALVVRSVRFAPVEPGTTIYPFFWTASAIEILKLPTFKLLKVLHGEPCAWGTSPE
jgi:hypothetical protein